jgi:muconolactone delta-isomerase
MEYLVTMTTRVPPGTPSAEVDDTLAREARRARELAAQGHLRRLWSLPAGPGVRRALGLWQAASSAEMAAIVDALPLRPWMAVETVPLTPHPNDPSGSASVTRSTDFD